MVSCYCSYPDFTQTRSYMALYIQWVKELLQTGFEDFHLRFLSPGISYFKLVDTGTSLYIQAHSDSNVKVCVDNDILTTGASGVAEMQTSGSGTTGVKIYFDETDGDRWYLRVYLNSADEEVVELVSQSYVDNVSTDKHTRCCGLQNTHNITVFETWKWSFFHLCCVVFCGN